MTVTQPLRDTKLGEASDNPVTSDDNSRAIHSIIIAVRNLTKAFNASITFLNRELTPVVSEMRKRFNERHGATVVTAVDYTVVEPVETVITTATVTITLPATSTGWTRYVRVIADNASTTIAVDSTDTNNGPGAVAAGSSAVFVPDNDNSTWYGG